tara:strand:+ start:79507 stop:79953 length:447 start_codon:yes stop_codon:yes gene_type:complete
MATKEELKGNWNTVVGAVKEKYGEISDDELAQVEGNVDQLVGLVQRKTGHAREQIEAFMHDCCSSCDSAMGRASDYANQARETIREGYDQASEQARRGYQYSATAVARHPLESVGTAFGVGIVAGLLIGFSLGAHRERDLSWRERWTR